MKIALLAPFGIRPKGTLLARMIPMAEALKKYGHEPVIVAPPYTNPEDSGREETIRGIMLKNICLKSPIGLTTIILSLRMYRAAMNERPDLIYLFKPKGYGGMAAMRLILTRSLGRDLPPLVVDSDDWEGTGGMNDMLPYSLVQRMVFDFQEQWILRRANAVTVASRELENRIRVIAGKNSPVIYISNGATPTKRGDGISARLKLGIPVDAPVALLYTRFFEFSQKRLHDLFSEIHTLAPEIRFLVVGAGRRGEEDGLLRVARQRGFDRELTMTGWVEPEYLPDILAAGDAAPYLFDDTLVNRTKCPAKLTELVNAGVAVVADRVGQLAEYLPESDDTLCLPGDWRKMARQVIRLLENNRLRRQVAAQQYEYMQSNFSWDGLTKSLDSLMRSLVCEK